ncbi:hypothetical protein [Deferrisoma camini]|uniref:hypothetical protein n=1 Tax=Deferrisoma camini TaxID=1035120 RepID=UPI00046CB776|nr:hypothetical protein [Deferrisoma camini]
MRKARQTPEGRWYVVESRDGVDRIGPADWRPDARGFWPRVEFRVRTLGAEIRCPACGTAWVLEEMDCVFGRCCRRGNDLLVLVRCHHCRLPHRVRGVGFVTAYPRMVRLMEGWAGWDRRAREFRAEEARVFGPEDEG